MTDFSYQLYSSRNFPPLENTFAMLSGLGYRAVEGYGALFDDLSGVDTLRAALDANDLSMDTGHFGLDMVESAPGKVVETAKALGLTDVYVPYLQPDDRPTDAAGWAALGKRLAEAGKPVQDAGLTFGWHNHDFEFADLGGSDLPMDLLLQASDDIMFEFDLAWAAVAGHDPLEWIKRYGARITSAHIKDIAPKGECADEDGWADVGEGVMDWTDLLQALKAAGTTHLIMEHDNPSDHRRFAERSINFTSKILA